MPGRRRVIAVLVAVLVAASPVAACQAGPVSQATSLPEGSATDAPSSSAAANSPAPSADAAASPSAAIPSPAATAASVPPKPAGTTFKLVKTTPNPSGTSTEEYQITWTSPAGVATAFVIYGVTDCLRYSSKYDKKPCLAVGMKIPKTSLKVLAETSGEVRAASVSWEVPQVGPGPYWAILIRATNTAGSSIFTIVHSENVCYQCTY